MFGVGGRVIYKLLRGRPLSQETTECSSSILFLVVNSDRSFSSAHRPDGPRSDFSNRQSSYRGNANPPEPIPNRPLRGERTRPPVYPPRPQNQQPRFTGRDNQDKDPSRLDDNDLLEKFKLGFDRKTDTPDSKQPPSPDSSYKTAASSEAPAPQPPPEEADEIFRKMKETGLIPNAVAMLDGLCKDGLVQEAMKLFGIMREKGTIPEVIIYTAVVEGFCKAQKPDDAIRIFRKMQSNGIAPNAISYGILIRWLCKVKRLDDAAEFCAEMVEAGQSPNTATFTGLVDGICREKGLEEAQNMINTMKQKGFYVDEKAIREYLEKKGPFPPPVWEAILGKNASQKTSLFH